MDITKLSSVPGMLNAQMQKQFPPRPYGTVDFLVDDYIKEKSLIPEIDEARKGNIDILVDSYLKNNGYEVIGELPATRPPARREIISDEQGRPKLAPPETTIGPLRPEVERPAPTGFGAPPEYYTRPKPPEPPGMVPSGAVKWGGAGWEEELKPDVTFWQEIKDTAKAVAAQKISTAREGIPGQDPLTRALIRGVTAGNVDTLGIIEKISGRRGLKNEVLQREHDAVIQELGYMPEGVNFVMSATTMAASLVPLAAVFMGATPIAAAATPVKALQMLARAEIVGTTMGLLRKPEHEGLLNRLKQVPPEVLFFTAFEGLSMTAQQIAKIINWNKQYGAYAKGGKWGRWEGVAPKEPGRPATPDRFESVTFTPEQVIEIKRKMDVNAASPGTYTFTPQEQSAINYFSDYSGPGWRSWRQGWAAPGTTVIPGEPAVPPTPAGPAAYAEVYAVPRKPRWSDLGDLFRRAPPERPSFENAFFSEFPEPTYWQPAAAPGAPLGAQPPPTGAAPRRTQAPPTTGPVRPGEAPTVSVEAERTTTGGWKWTFRPGVTEPVPPGVEEALNPEVISQLPPHIQEIAKQKPRVFRPRGPRHYKDPELEAINRISGLKPDKDFSFSRLRELRLPIDLIKKTGSPMDIAAQHLMHEFPELDTPSMNPSDALFSMLEKRAGRRATGKTYAEEAEGPVILGGIGADEAEALAEDYYIESWRRGDLDRSTISPAEQTLIDDLKARGHISDEDFGIDREREPEAEGFVTKEGALLGEFEGRGYQGPDKELVRAEYADWLRGQAPPKKGDRLAPPKEITPEMVAEQKTLRRQAAEELIAERGTTPGLFGEELKEPEPAPNPPKPEQAKLFEAEAPTSLEARYRAKGLSQFDDINVWRKKVQPFLDEGAVIEFGHTGGAKGWSRVTGTQPAPGKLVRSTTAKAPEFGEAKPAVQQREIPMEQGELKEAAPSKDAIRRKLAELLPKLNVPREKWGEVSRRVLENFAEEGEGNLEGYINKTARWLTEEGEPRPRKGAVRPVSIEGRAEPIAETPSPHDRFASLEEEARLRDIVTKQAGDKIDLDILDSRIFKSPPESLEEIGNRHGISKQAIDKRWVKLMEKLQGDPDLKKLARRNYELHSFPGTISEEDLRGLRDMINKYFRSTKGVSQEVDMANDERIGGILSAKFGSTVEAKGLDKFLKDNDNNPAVVDLVKRVLMGEQWAAGGLPQEIVSLLTTMRGRIDGLSQMIIANGALPANTKTVFEDNIGKYLGKYYRLYEKIAKAKGRLVKRYWNPPEPVRQRFKAALQRDFPSAFGTYTDQELDNFLDGMVRDENFYGGTGRRTKRIPSEHYVRRIRLTPEFREFAGEIMDPRYLYLKTIGDQAAMAHNAKFLKLIKTTYPDLWTNDYDKARRLGWQKSQMPEDWHSYGEMAGLYVHPELREYIQHEVFPARSGAEKMYEQYILNPFKWTKTIGSIPTHMRNFLGNPMFSAFMQNAIWNPLNARHYIKGLKVIKGREGRYKDEWERLIKHGVTETQFWGAEIPRFHDELLRLDPASWPEKIYDHTIRAGITKVSNLYNAEDLIYRIAGYYKLTEHFGMTPQEAVREINLGMTNYRKLPVIVEFLRRYPALGPFISFKYNVAKIIGSQAEEAARDFTAGGGRRWKGIRRALILAGMLMGPYALSELSKQVFDIDDEAQQTIEKYRPPWQRHGLYVYWRNSKGEAKAFDLTYLYPVGDLQKAGRALLAGDIASFKDAASLFVHPVFDIYSILAQDRDPQWGTKLPGGFDKQLIAAFKHIYLPSSMPIPSIKALVKEREIRAGDFTPYQVKTLIDAWYGEAPMGQEPKHFPEELKNFLTGVRTFDVDPRRIMGNYIRSKTFEIRAADDEFKSWLRKNPRARIYEKQDKMKKLMETRTKLAEQIKQANHDALLLRKGGFNLESPK